MVLAQQKKLYEKDAILMDLEKKIVAVEVMKSVDDKSKIEEGKKHQKKTAVQNAILECLKRKKDCNDKYFLNTLHSGINYIDPIF